MKNVKLLDELNALSNGRFAFLRLSKIDLDLPDKACRVFYMYPESARGFDEAAQTEAAALTERILAGGFRYEVQFKKSHVDADLLAADVLKFLKLNPMIAAQTPALAAELLQGGAVKLALTFPPEVCAYAEETGLKGKLADYLDTAYCADFHIDFLKKEPETAAGEGLPPPEPKTAVYTQTPVQYTPVAEVSPFIGGIIEDKPRRIKDLNFAHADACAAGKIADLRMFDIKNGKNPEGRHVFSIMLRDHTGQIKVLYFSRPETDQKTQTLKTGDTLIVAGELEKEEFNGRSSFTLKARRIGFCELPPPPEEKKYKAPYPEKYRTVFPQKRVDFAQEDLFGMAAEPCRYLKGRDFVVFDTETTGLSPVADKIIEISAYKIRNGRIVEEFSTLINPGVHITDEITGITGLADKDVADAPAVGDVIMDFYKFTQDSVLVAHNIGFDIAFIERAGEKLGCLFGNEQVDTIKLAQEHVRGLTRFNLAMVCKALNIDNTRAHRAASDALATAEVLLKLAPQIVA
ncbi:MAG: hypothetical protein LBL66_03705 [Clostridiales bacterium]|jgi:DNA polymerase III epsilon subunit family exonuclease|nr:hypothetical protein [Clostridiales bacterium]